MGAPDARRPQIIKSSPRFHAQKRQSGRGASDNGKAIPYDGVPRTKLRVLYVVRLRNVPYDVEKHKTFAIFFVVVYATEICMRRMTKVKSRPTFVIRFFGVQKKISVDFVNRWYGTVHSHIIWKPKASKAFLQKCHQKYRTPCRGTALLPKPVLCTV